MRLVRTKKPTTRLCVVHHVLPSIIYATDQLDNTRQSKPANRVVYAFYTSLLVDSRPIIDTTIGRLHGIHEYICNSIICIIVYQNYAESARNLINLSIKRVSIIQECVSQHRISILDTALESAVCLPDYVITNVIMLNRRYSARFTRILSKSLCCADMSTLLSITIIYNRTECVNIILDSGRYHVTEDDNNFILAISKCRPAVVREFIRRGVVYDNAFIHRYARNNVQMRDLLLSGLIKL